MSFTTIVNDTLENVGGLIHSWVGLADIIKNTGARWSLEGSEGFIVIIQELIVDGELEFTANGRNAASNFSAIDGTGIPGIDGNKDGGHGGTEVTVIGGNGDSFV